MSILRETLTLLRNLPDLIADWCDRTVMDVHRMTDLGEPGAPEPWCLRCNAVWPCTPFVEASDRKATRR